MPRPITESLEIIDAWTKHYWASYSLQFPEEPDFSNAPMSYEKYMHELVVPKMNSGLTYAQIEDKLTALPFKVPQEVIELYHWHDGGKPSSIPFPYSCELGQRFYALDQAIEISLCHHNPLIQGGNIFILFGMDDMEYWTVGSQEQTDKGAIYSDDCLSCARFEPEFTSLTDFFDSVVNEIPADRSQWTTYS